MRLVHASSVLLSVVFAVVVTLALASHALMTVSAIAQEPVAETFLYALQDDAGTTVYRHEPDGDTTVVFNDRDTDIVIHELEMTTRLVTTAAGRLFAYVKPRTPGDADFFPRGQTVLRRERYRTYVYELHTDGSNSARKIAEVLGTQSPRRFLVSPSGEHVAYLNVEWERDAQGTSHEFHWLYVHDTRTGELAWKVDAGLRSYDNFRGAAWLDEFSVYMWRLPVVEEHLAQDQDFSESVGPHVIDIRTGTATPLDSTVFLTMLDEEARRQEDAAPECGLALGARTLACSSSSSAYQRNDTCHGVLRERRAYTLDLDEMRPTQLLRTEPTCADRWFVSPSTQFIVGLESRVAEFRIAGRSLLLYEPSQTAAEATPIAETSTPEPLLVPVGWAQR